MMIESSIDFLRVLGAFLLVFLVVPLVGEGYRLWRGEPFDQPTEDWIPILLRGFVHASFAAEIAAVLLGHLKLCLPGVLVSGCVLWCVRGMRGGLKKQNRLGEEEAQGIWRTVFAYLDPGGGLGKRSPVAKAPAQRLWHTSNRTKLLLILIGLIVLIEVRAPLRQVHFAHQETYSRAVSLAALTQGQSWDGDGSVAILAPLVSFSGLNAAPVIRFTGAIFALALALLLAFCVWRVWNSWASAMLVLISFIGAALAAGRSNGELLPPSIAMVYGMSAAAVWPRSRRAGCLAALTALMIAPTEWRVLLLCAVMLVAGLLSVRAFEQGGRWSAAVLTTLVALGSIAFEQRSQAGTPAYHYESAARTCEAIGRSFHRNEWLVVSPFQELACTYGQGWHVELSSFVSKFSVEQVSRPDFAFPYDIPDVFFFVERRPLPVGVRPGSERAVWRYAPAGSDEWSAFLYGDPVGRASLEFQAAELLNAYAQTHRNVTLFYGDADLLVYHVVRTTAGT